MKDRTQWTYNDIGIFLADAAAEGNWAAIEEILGINGYLPEVTTKCDDLLGDILKPGIWHWRHADLPHSPPALDELMLHVQYSHLRKYTAKRDEYRAIEEDPPRWADINPALAYAVCPHKPTTSAQILQASLRAWRKSYRYGNNRGKGLNGAARTTAEECPHCKEPETPSHIYAECQAAGLPRIRARVQADQARALATLSRPSIPEWQRLFFENIYALAFTVEDDFSEKIWNATLGCEDMHCLFASPEDAARDLSATEFQDFKKAFVRFVTPFTAAAIEMEQVKFKLKFGSISSSLQSALRRSNMTPVPHENDPIDPAHPIITTLNVRIQPNTRTPRPNLHFDTPPTRRNEIQQVLGPQSDQSGTTPCMAILSSDENLHISRQGTDPCDLPCHRAGPETPSSLDDTAPVIDPEPPPD